MTQGDTPQPSADSAAPLWAGRRSARALGSKTLVHVDLVMWYICPCVRLLVKQRCSEKLKSPECVPCTVRGSVVCPRPASEIALLVRVTHLPVVFSVPAAHNHISRSERSGQTVLYGEPLTLEETLECQKLFMN